MQNKRKLTGYKRISTEEETKIKGTSGFKSIFDFKKLCEYFGMEKIPFYKWTEGSNYFDVYPHTMGEKNPTVVKKPKNQGLQNYRLYVNVHRNIGHDKSEYVCPAQFGKPCPACDESGRLRDIDEKTSKKLFASTRNYSLIDPYVDGEKKGLHILHTGHFKSFGVVLEAYIKYANNKGMRDFCHPEEGYTLEVQGVPDSFPGPGGKTIKYINPTRVDFIDRTQEIDFDLFEKVMHCKLDSFLVIPTYEELEEALFGKAPKMDEEEDDNTQEETDSTEDVAECSGCPKDHTFGTDWEKFDDCTDCEDDDESTHSACHKAKKQLRHG